MVTFTDEKNITALTLSLISGLSTGLGGFIVVFFGAPKNQTVGTMLGFASGYRINYNNYIVCF